MFFNITNHPSERWGAEQLQAAQQLGGDIVDIPFPAVAPEATREEIGEMSEKLVSSLSLNEGDVALVQGEFTLVFSLVTRLKSRGVKAVAATSSRLVTEVPAEDGTSKKEVTFKFVQFREY